MTGQVSVGLHLGVHKTASTHLQYTLRNSSEALIEKGVRYYGPDFLRLRGRSIEQMFGLGTSPSPRRSTADQIAFLAKGDGRILISEENFFGPLLERNGKGLVPPYSGGERAVAELAGLLAAEGSPLDLYFAIRSPASFVTSRYSQILLSGTFLSPEDYAAMAKPEGIDWAEMVAALASVPNNRSLYVWRYEDYARILPSILSAMVGSEAAGSVAPAETVVNPGFSAIALRRYLVARERGNKWLTPARALGAILSAPTRLQLRFSALRNIAATRSVIKIRSPVSDLFQASRSSSPDCPGADRVENRPPTPYVAANAFMRWPYGTHQPDPVHPANPRRDRQGRLALAPRGSFDHQHGLSDGDPARCLLRARRSSDPFGPSGRPDLLRILTRKAHLRRRKKLAFAP